MCPQTPGAASGGLASRRPWFSPGTRLVGARAAFAASAGFAGRSETF
jgi:hypothetical protein